MTKKNKRKQKSKPNRMVDISTMGVKHERAGTERWDKKYTSSRWGGKRKNIT